MSEIAKKFMSNYSYNDIWDFVKNRLFNEYGESVYKAWISTLSFSNINNGILLLTTSNDYNKDWINRHYADSIKKLWKVYDHSLIELRVVASKTSSQSLTKLNDKANNAQINLTHISNQEVNNHITQDLVFEKNVSPAQKPTSFEEIWDLVKNKLLIEYGEKIYISWISKLELVNAQNGILELAVPTKFIREWIRNHYLVTIKRFWRSYDESIFDIEIMISSSQIEIPTIIPQVGEETVINKAELLKPSNGIHDDVFNTPLDRRFTFDNFVVGTPNELAYAAARSVAESPKVQSEANPLFLYGGVGLGKTHLMHAVAWHIKNNDPSRKVIYISAEKFMYQFIKALRNHDVMSFKDLLRSVDVLMIDDVQFICGKDSTQAEFFHTLNALIDNNRQVIISADRSPSDLDGMEERIKSRLGWGLVADVHSTTYELRVGILMSKLEQMKISVPIEVIEFLADKITSNVRELEGALNKVVAHSTLVGRTITLESTQEILQDLLRSNIKIITIDEIKKKVAERKNVKLSDLSSNSRERHIVRARQLAMYLSRTLTHKSLAEIGKNFGGRDHTTVMHAIKQIEDLMQLDPEIAEDVKLLSKILQN